MTAPVQTTAPAVQQVAPAACTAAAAPPPPDAAHVTPEAAAASAKDFKANKKCPCPNCRPAAPVPAAAGNAGAAKGTAKGGGSFGANVKRGGEGDMVWQLGKSAAQQGRKQQQQQQQQGGKAAAAAQGGKAAGGKAGGKGGKGSKQQFDVKALPAKPLMAAPTGKQVTEAKASCGLGIEDVGQRCCAQACWSACSTLTAAIMVHDAACCTCLSPALNSAHAHACPHPRPTCLASAALPSLQPQPKKPKESFKVS